MANGGNSSECRVETAYVLYYANEQLYNFVIDDLDEWERQMLGLMLRADSKKQEIKTTTTYTI